MREILLKIIQSLEQQSHCIQALVNDLNKLLPVIDNKPIITKNDTDDNFSNDIINNPFNFDDIDWPEAIPTIAISDYLQTKLVQFLCDLTTYNIPFGNMLDYGCGDGAITNELANYGSIIGYDITKYDSWSSYYIKLTSNLDDITEAAPFDTIIVNDVLDHARGQTPSEIISFLYELLDDNGKLFIRCHPWTSRHGGHLHTTINKAYSHLFIPSNNLKNYNLQHNLKIIRPLATYESWFKEINLKPSMMKIIPEAIPEYIKQPNMTDYLIKEIWNGQITQDQMHKIMLIQLVDYIITK